MSTSNTEAIEFDPSVVGNLPKDDDAESSSLHDSATSIAASIYEYRTIHGRSYQSSKTTEYWAPTDAKQIQGHDLIHQIMLMLMDNKLFCSPAENLKNILDVGTGTGIWAIDMADEFPSATVIGTDISPIQPTWVPPNCSFQIDDAQLDWTFDKDAFDLVHVRHLYGGIDSWPRLYAQAFAHVRPGGWFENSEIDLETRSENPAVANDADHVFKTWCRLFWDAGDRVGKTFKIARDRAMERYMAEAGFVDIQHLSWKLPIGSWPRDPLLKRVGQLNGLFIDQSLDGFALFPLGQIMGWSMDEVNALVDKMRVTLADPKSMAYYVVHTVYGRKPL